MPKSLLLFVSAVVLSLLAVRSFAETSDPTPFKWTEQFAGQPLDLTGYELTFSDDFNSQSVTGEYGKGPWLAPVHDSYGVAVFDKPGADNSTYTIANGLLT